jgi:hypothetical protein
MVSNGTNGTNGRITHTVKKRLAFGAQASFIQHPFSPLVFLSFSKRVDKKPIRILSRQLVMRRRRSNVFVCLFALFYLLRRERRNARNQRRGPHRSNGRRNGRDKGSTQGPLKPFFSFTQLIHLSTPTTQMPYNTLTLRSRLSISSITVPGKDPPSSLGNKRFFFPSSFLFF